MGWLEKYLKAYPDLTPAEWHEAVKSGNPDESLPPELRHDANQAGAGPESKWLVEASASSFPANYRTITATLPYGFPRITAETLFTDGHVVRIGGMAAPSEYGRNWLEGDHGHMIRGMISFLGSAGSRVPFPYQAIPWKDFTANDQSLETALKNARDKLEDQRFDPRVTPCVFFHCAWGLGRTGTVLAIYQLMDLVMKEKHKQECQDYFTQPRIKDVEIIVHGDNGRYKKVLTTQAVALAINQIRRSTDSPMVAVELESQIRLIERYEESMALAMCNYLKRSYSPAQEGSLSVGLIRSVESVSTLYKRRLPQAVKTDQIIEDHFGQPKALAEPKSVITKSKADKFKQWLKGGMGEEGDEKTGKGPPTSRRR